ncbi:FAD-binding oxidoreductase [Brevibacterium spongiae]|uniref:FAD-binding oxidoreductase n=1 Tax=Brevibacterium spongiae TaxID=2909672 RepID=A0ABY5SJW3_9MICO|nr:FAD-binding oxidoreductase [Brevibacterium spongiae]UVI34817.1 FAD-binding oxidoreductase [Brevibacterium spongiae]
MSRTTDELPRLASPETIAELSELMARAHTERRTVAVFGGGTAFDDHPPVPTPGLLIDLTGLAEVAERSSADLSIRAGAGARVSALDRIAARTGHEILPDLPADRIEAGSSLGGMIATAALGPRHLRRPRIVETVLSVTTVGADGTIARTADGLSSALAGRSLPSVLSGSWGTRAIIVEAEIRLTPRPASQDFVWIPGTEAAADLLIARRGPDAVVIERPPGSPAATIALVEGESAEVEAEIGFLTEQIPGARPCARPEWWARRARMPVTISLSVAPDFLPGLLETVSRLEDAIGYPLQLRGSASGRFELGLGAPETEPGVAARVVLEHLRSFGLHRISARLLHAPAALWDELDAWGPLVGRRNLQETKDDLDPHGLLSPGRGLGGI